MPSESEPLVVVRPTADVELGPLRALLDVAYDHRFDDVAFGHALGGVHVTICDGGELVAHAAVVLRQLRCAATPVRTGWVEAVAVRPDRRRCGLGALVMAEVERLIHGGYGLGALASSSMAREFYAGRGWVRWTGPLAASTADGTVPTPDDAVFVLPVGAAPDVTSELVCDRRGGADGW